MAHLLRPQGRKGELLAELFTDFPERFDDQKRVFLAAPGFDGEPADARSAEVVVYWLPVGKNEGRIVMQFAGIETITSAESITGLDVIVPREERLPLDDESVYISELVGCTLYDGPVAVGVVADVRFAMTPDGGRRLGEAAPLLTVTSSDGAEILVPFVKAFLINLDLEAKRIDMRLPQGLIEINQTGSREPDAKAD